MNRASQCAECSAGVRPVSAGSAQASVEHSEARAISGGALRNVSTVAAMLLSGGRELVCGQPAHPTRDLVAAGSALKDACM
jgi:hypothetical protein